jgi:serine/threonine protein phosphatase 1
MNEKMKTIAFGDVHGCYKAAESAVKLAEELKVQAIFLGDYVDRGPSAVKTLRVLIQAKENHPDWVFLRGNHDQMLLDLINEDALTTDVRKVLGAIQYDYKQASASYEEWKALENEEQSAILSFLNSTMYYFENKKYIFIHAIINMYGGLVSQKTKELLIWNYDYHPIWYGKMFVHGHSPVKHPSLRFNGINVNTECGYGGCLTGVVTDSNSELLEFYTISEDGARISDFKIYSNQYNSDHPLTISLSEDSNENLEVYPFDYENLFDWNEANAECKKLGGGWRLPTVDEMSLIYDQLYKKNLGHFEEKEYWCSNYDDIEDALFFAFYASGGFSDLPKHEKLKFRPVRHT